MNGRQRGRIQPSPCENLPELLGCLAGDVRFELVTLLAAGPRTVGELVDRCGLTMPHVSYNLGLLWDHALVDREQVKCNRVYRLSGSVEVAAEGDFIRLRTAARNGDELLVRMRQQKSSSQPDSTGPDCEV